MAQKIPQRMQHVSFWCTLHYIVIESNQHFYNRLVILHISVYRGFCFYGSFSLNEINKYKFAISRFSFAVQSLLLGIVKEH